MLIPSKFNGYFNGRRTCFDGGGGDGGGGGDPGDSVGDVGSSVSSGIGTGFGDMGDVGDAGMGGSYDPYGYGQSQSQSQYAPPPPYTAQQLPSANTAIYKPSYTDYSLGRPDTVGTYGQNFQPYFSQGIGGYQMPYLMSNFGGGVADLYSNPQYFSNYGIAGLYR